VDIGVVSKMIGRLIVAGVMLPHIQADLLRFTTTRSEGRIEFLKLYASCSDFLKYVYLVHELVGPLFVEAAAVGC
jgi:hypothetical protein